MHFRIVDDRLVYKIFFHMFGISLLFCGMNTVFANIIKKKENGSKEPFSIRFSLGGKWGSNPRPSGPQSDTLTN